MDSKKEKSLNGRTSISQQMKIPTHRKPNLCDPRVILYDQVGPNKNKRRSKKKKAIRDQAIKRKKKQIIRKLRGKLGEILDTEEEKKVLRMEIEQEKLDRRSYNTFANELLLSYNRNDEINDEKNDKPKTYSKKKY